MRSEAVANRMVEKLFAERKGHGGAQKIVERHLRAVEVYEIVKVAYEIGYQDGRAAEPKKG